MRKILLFLLVACAVMGAKAQTGGGVTVFGTIYNGDTIPMEYLDPVVVNGYISPLTASEKKTYAKLIRDVKKAYPFAKQVQQLLESYNYMLSNAQNDSQKDKIKKQAMNDIQNKFQNKTKHLTKKQGKILSKLIYRQTGSSSYALIKAFGGGVKATLAQATAKAMGVSLNASFSPQTDSEDKMIERIIYCIDANVL